LWAWAGSMAEKNEFTLFYMVTYNLIELDQ
jgi:hypothetical protein